MNREKADRNTEDKEAISASISDNSAQTIPPAASQEDPRLHYYITSTLPNSVSFVTSDYRYQAVNPAYSSFYGVEREKIIGHPIAEFCGEEVFETEIRPRFDQCLGGEEVRYELEVDLPAKGRRRMAMHYFPYRDESGAVLGVVSHGQDITEKHESEIQLKKSLEKTRRREMQAEALLTASQAVMECYRFEEAARRIFDACCRVTGAVSGYVALLSPDGAENEVLFLEAGGLPCTVDESLPMPIRGLRGVAYSESRVVYENDFMNSPWVDFMPPGHVRLRNVMFAPLSMGGRVVGVMGLANKPADFTEEDAHIAGAFGDIAAIALQRARTEESIRDLSARLQGVLYYSPLLICEFDLEGRYQLVNRAICTLLNMEEKDLIGKSVRDLLPAETADLFMQRIRNVSDTRTSLMVEDTINVDGSDRIFNTVLFPLLNEAVNEVASVAGIGLDITERSLAERDREKLREQLMQSQKLESVGRLAGGVAHDFNNMLGVIHGNTEMAIDSIDSEHPAFFELSEIKSATERSADLVRQLLAFARKQTVLPKVLDINDTVEGMLKMLRRLIGENINLIWVPGAETWPVRIDPSQLDQLMANLCVNAKDAIQDVGRIRIATANTHISESDLRGDGEQQPGEYVLLTISDDGCGMDEETIENIFEAFFTTKGTGEGTGLGLSTVYGIVKQNRGFITVNSTPGEGTTFSICLPRFCGRHESGEKQVPPQAPTGYGETILVVEDEAPTLTMSTRMLQKLGYTVLPAATPGEAFELADQHAESISLLITDVIMPEMNGRELSIELTRKYPGMKVLYMTGYTADVITNQGVLDEETNYIQKPFSRQTLASCVRQVLDA